MITSANTWRALASPMSPHLRPLHLCLAALPALFATVPACAAGFDHPLTPSNTGIWSTRYTHGLEFAAIATEFGGALWLGDSSELGRTCWQAIDATVFSAAAAQGVKWATGRKRPSQSSSPDQWFQGMKYQSFPSGEVTLQASFVTPLIMNYREREPWIWALELLPAYDAAARVKQGAHWQTDALAGWALGTGFGYLATRTGTPIILSVLPHGFAVGIRHSW